MRRRSALSASAEILLPGLFCDSVQGDSAVVNIFENLGVSSVLEKDGLLFLVIRREQGAKSLIVDLKKVYTVDVLTKKKGFFIIQCY